MSTQLVKNYSRAFGDRLCELRAGIPKAVFARKLGISNPSTYQNYESGRVPDLQLVQHIATVCGVSITWLLDSEEDNAVQKDAIHDSGCNRPTKPGNSNMAPLRDSATPTYGRSPAPPPQPLCRFPADCNLTERLTSMESALVTMSAQVQTLTQLLGATLAASVQHVAPSAASGEQHKRKAG